MHSKADRVTVYDKTHAERKPSVETSCQSWPSKNTSLLLAIPKLEVQ